MPTVPVGADRVFWSPLTTFVLSGVTYQSQGKVEIKWGYTIHREITTGTNTPYYGTGAFEGKMEFDGYGSSDNRWDDAVNIASGIVPTFGMTAQERDTAGLTNSGARTWTISGKFTEYTKIWDTDKVIRYRLKGEIVTVPTVVQS